jgi:hypothetical protein
MPRRKNLVIVRAGDESLHEQWLGGDEDRNWDLIVNYFGNDPGLYRKDDVQRIDSKGPKWPALHDLIQKFNQDVFSYDRVWLPDDDLRATKADINSLFDIFERHGLALAQPALTPDSHLGHLITLRNRSFHLRFTNFVEIMAPCFCLDFLKQMLPSFNSNLSGWGLDFIWPTKISDWTRIAIIDAVAVCHTRPVGGPNYRHLAGGGKTPQQEVGEVLAKYGLTKVELPFVRGGIDKSDRRLSMYDPTARELIDNIMIGYLPEVGNNPQALMTLVRPNLDRLCLSAPAAAPSVAVVKASVGETIKKPFDGFAVKKEQDKLSVIDFGGYETRNESTLSLIKKAFEFFSIKDFDWTLINTCDRESQLFHEGLKVLAYSTDTNNFAHTCPDFVYDHWRQTGLLDYEEVRSRLSAISSRPLTDTLGWRGAATNPVRDILVKFDDKTDFDCEFVHWDRSDPSNLKAKNYISFHEQVDRWRYLIDVEGTGYSGRLKLLLSSPRVVFLQDRPHKEDFFQHLIPWSHFVPVKRDLSDLRTNLEIIKSDSKLEISIIEGAREFSQKYLSRASALKRWSDLLNNQSSISTH